MAIHPIARWLLIVAAIAVALGAPRENLVPCAAMIALAYILVGQVRMFAAYLLLVAPFLAVAAALWSYVYFDPGHADFGDGVRRLFKADSNFLMLIRTLLGTALIVLALRSVPDGETYPVLRRMGFPKSVAFVFTSGMALVATVRDAFERSLVALKAQGILRQTFPSRVANLGRAVGLTWLAGLTAAATRAEIKWDGNGFVDQLENRSIRVSIGAWPTAVSLFVAAGLIALSFTSLRALVHGI